MKTPFPAERCWFSSNEVLSRQNCTSTANASCKKTASSCRGRYPLTRCTSGVVWKPLVTKKKFQRTCCSTNSEQYRIDIVFQDRVKGMPRAGKSCGLIVPQLCYHPKRAFPTSYHTCRVFAYKYSELEKMMPRRTDS
mmetsp:Transcript_2132/g.13989  ORF Transcript_2132/g.13989 Transcript_2132/m.13989 type:complete len:137 (-) Transcript_2132:2870-3280(-)